MPEPEDKKLENQFGCSPHDNFGEVRYHYNSKSIIMVTSVIIEQAIMSVAVDQAQILIALNKSITTGSLSQQDTLIEMRQSL